MTQLTERLDRFEHSLRSMETELVELRRLARREEAPAREPEAPLWDLIAPEPAPQPSVDSPAAPPEPLTPPVPREPFDFSALFGARALAWTGGTLMLLGVVFFFVLAVERGWIGPAARVTLGAVAAGALVAAGVWLRRAYGDTYASVSAAGAGIAGLYATLLAAAALYDLVPSPMALLAAVAIAAVGAAVALSWNSQTLASLGLVGAMLVPVPIALQSGTDALATAFAGLVLAAAIVVAVRRDWRELLVVSFVVTAPQGIALAFVDHHHAYAMPITAAYWLLYGGAGVWLAMRTRLTYLPATLLVFSAAFGGWSAGILYEDRAQGSH